MGELLNRIGSSELDEWIIELAVLRPEDEDKAIKKAEQEAKWK